jgi:tRNA A-37 threonylcarbamoyl transferase component Bud32/tetratricopeptide (TPR) repeat protein
VTQGGGLRIDVAIAGYRVDSVIGHGGMATVYRAEQLSLRREVALKILAPELADSTEFRARFLEESRLAARLDDAAVVPIYDAGEAEGVLFIAMRHVPGGDLRGLLLREGRLEPQAVSSVLRQLAGGLDAAHALGLVHRDVKPSNVLVEDARAERPRVYISDFGLARGARAIEQEDAGVRGSLPYLPPERILGEDEDARSDVYSLGCLIYECLTGAPPFVRDSEEELLYAHLRAPYPSAREAAPWLPAEIDDALAAALAKSREERPASAGALAEAVGRALGAPAEHDGAAPRVQPEPERVAVVGRLPEETLLLAGLRRALRGRGELVMVAGEAGIGKTTLARRVCDEAGRLGAPVAWAAGGAFGESAPPYWHWAQVVRALARAPGGADLLQSLGAQAGLLGSIAPELGGAGPQLGEGSLHLYDALGQLLWRAAEPSGLVVVLDDLQDADEATLRALAFIAGQLRDHGVLILGTYREGELRPGAAPDTVAQVSPLADLAGTSRRVSLAALDRDDVRALVAQRVEGEAPAELAERVYSVTGGNPLFVTELLNLLESRGPLEEAGAELETMPLPQGVSDAISERLAPLSARAHGALSVAAVIGPRFRAGTLSRAAKIPPGQLLELLDEAVASELIRPTGDPLDGYAFSHGLVRTALYEALPRSRRCALHAAVGEALLESYDAATGEGLAELAYHFLEAAPAGEAERAIAYARRAGERAAETFAYDEAVALYGRALELLDASRSRERTELLQALGDAQMRVGDTETARETLRRAAATARANGDHEGLARAALASNIWGLTFGVDEPLVRLAEEAEQQLADGSSPGLLACVKGMLATALYWSSGQEERRLRLAEEALALARTNRERLGNAESGRMLAYVLGRYLLARWGPRSANEDIGTSEELVALCRELGEIELEILVRNWRVIEMQEIGRFSDVDREIARIEQMAGELRQPRAMVFLPLHYASRAGTEGRFAEAERLNAESYEIGLRVRGSVGELAAVTQLLTIRLQQGRLAELESSVRAIAAANPGMVGMRGVLALMHVQNGREQECRAELDEVLASGLAGMPFDNVHVVTLALLGEAAAELGDAGHAHALYEWLTPYEGRWVVSPNSAALWPVSRSLARLATATGSYEAARGHLLRAREQALGAGARPTIALAALDEARLLLASEPGAERERVASLARQARELAQELGMGLVVDAATLVEASSQ